MSEVPYWVEQFRPLDAAEKAAEIKWTEELKQMAAKMHELQHAECNKQITNLTAERDGLQASLQLGVQADTDLRKRYEALEKENAELTRKGQELCCAYGNALITIADLKAQVERLSAKVKNEEWINAIEVWGAGSGDREPAPHGWAMTRSQIDTLIAARTTPTKEPNDWVCEACHARYAEYVNGCPKCWANGEKRSGVRHQPASK